MYGTSNYVLLDSRRKGRKQVTTVMYYRGRYWIKNVRPSIHRYLRNGGNGATVPIIRHTYHGVSGGYKLYK